jgi:chemotaxis protein MotB
MAKKVRKKPEECHEETAPLWYITYADMITQITALFVVMFTMSEVKSEKVHAVMRQFQIQFGLQPKLNTNVQIFQQPKAPGQTPGRALPPGPRGRHDSVQTLTTDEAARRVIGGKALFEPGSAVLTPEGQQLLSQDIAPSVRGYSHRICIRGHTATTPAGESPSAEDTWALSFERAQAVMRFLADRCRIEERLFELDACGAQQPVATNQTPEGREQNRRIEILMTEEVIPPAPTPPAQAPP